MNLKLQKAEEALLKLLQGRHGGITMEEILKHFGKEMAEAELRAAVWTLRAEGLVDFDDQGKLREAQEA